MSSLTIELIMLQQSKINIETRLQTCRIVQGRVTIPARRKCSVHTLFHFTHFLMGPHRRYDCSKGIDGKVGHFLNAYILNEGIQLRFLVSLFLRGCSWTGSQFTVATCKVTEWRVFTSVADPVYFFPDPDPRIWFFKSGSGWPQKDRIRPDPDPT